MTPIREQVSLGTAPMLETIRVERYQGMHEALTVTPVWAGVDRPDCYGIVVTSQRIADRLVRAINAGVIFTNPRVMTDRDGKTFVAHDTTVRGRCMNADLRALGF